MSVCIEAPDMAPASPPVAAHLDPDIYTGFAAIRSLAYATPTQLSDEQTRLGVVMSDLELSPNWLSTVISRFRIGS